MKTVFYYLFIFYLVVLFLPNQLLSQSSPDNYDGGLKVKLNEDGSKYFRLITWAQFQVSYADNNQPNQSRVNFNLRRARFLMYSQIGKKFLILTHFGLNSLNRSTMSPTGTGQGSQLFFHDVWGQYSLGKKNNHAIGGGLHYFNGISRLNNQSTLNMMTMDNNRESWSTIGLSDQFARHLGVFAKGKFKKFQYRVAVNQALNESLDIRDPVFDADAVYGGVRLLGSKTAGFTYSGYFEYQIFDEESNFLPYKVGTYLGDKKLLNIGAGFFVHPNGSVIATDSLGAMQGQDVQLFAGDIFFEMPLGEKAGSLSAYATYQYNDYGRDYLYSAYGSGSMIYGQLGYALPGDKNKIRFQPYVAFCYNMYDVTPDTRTATKVGFNTYLSGHHSKLTLEYQHSTFGGVKNNAITLQAMIYL